MCVCGQTVCGCSTMSVCEVCPLSEWAEPSCDGHLAQGIFPQNRHCKITACPVAVVWICEKILKLPPLNLYHFQDSLVYATFQNLFVYLSNFYCKLYK